MSRKQPSKKRRPTPKAKAQAPQPSGPVEIFLIKAPEARRWILAGGIVSIPFLVVRAVNDPINLPKLALLFIVVALVGAIRSSELLLGASARGLGRILVPGVAVVTPLAIAWLFSSYRGWTFMGEYGRFQGFLPYAAVILFGVLVADSFRDRLPMLAWAIAVAGGAVGALAVLQVTGLDPLARYAAPAIARTASSTLGNPNFTGGFLAITLPLALALVVEDKARRRQSISLLVAIVGGLIVSFSQGPYAAAVTGLAVTGGFYLSQRWSWARLAGLLSAAAVTLAVVVSAFAVVIAPDAAASLPLTIRLRGYWWEAALGMALDSPLVGHGPNAFGVLGVQHRPIEEAVLSTFEFPDDPHSVLMSVFANAGVLGVIGLGVLAWWVLGRARRLGAEDRLPIAFVGALVAYFVQSLVSLDELSLRLLLWTCVAGLGIATMSTEQEPNQKAASEKETRRSVSPKPSAPVIGGMAATMIVPIIVAWWSFGLRVADGRVLTAQKYALNNDTDQAEEQLDRALGFRNELEYRHIGGFALGDAAVKRGSGSAGEEIYAAAMRLFEYTDRFPDLPALRDRARIAYAAGRAGVDADGGQHAVDLYLRAVEIDAMNPLLRSEAASAMLTVGLYEEVESLLSGYLEDVFDRNAALWGQLALARAHLGEDEAARAAIDRALAIDPAEAHALEAQELLQ